MTSLSSWIHVMISQFRSFGGNTLTCATGGFLFSPQLGRGRAGYRSFRWWLGPSQNSAPWTLRRQTSKQYVLDPHGSWIKYRFMFGNPFGILQMMASRMFTYFYQVVQCPWTVAVLMSWLRSWPTPCRGHWVFPAQKARECFGEISQKSLDANIR